MTTDGGFVPAVTTTPEIGTPARERTWPPTRDAAWAAPETVSAMVTLAIMRRSMTASLGNLKNATAAITSSCRQVFGEKWSGVFTASVRLLATAHNGSN